MQRLKGIGVSPGARRSAAPCCSCIQRRRSSAFRSRRIACDASSRRSTERARDPASSSSDIRRASPRPGLGPRAALRRAAADARRSDARRPRRGPSSARSASTPSGRSSAPSTRSSSVFDASRTRTCASARATSHDVVGRLRMNLRGRARGARDLLQRRRRPVRARRRRARAVGGGAARLDARPRLRDGRRQPHLPHGDPRALARRARHRRPARRDAPRSRRRRSSSSTATPAS